MSLLGNIVWFVLGGWVAMLGYFVAGVVMMITIIGIPFGLQAFKLAGAVAFPFGREMRPGAEADSPLRIIFNIIWLVLFGWELAINHLVWALLFAITIVGLPFAYQHLKLAVMALWPFGYAFD